MKKGKAISLGTSFDENLKSGLDPDFTFLFMYVTPKSFDYTILIGKLFNINFILVFKRIQKFTH